MIDASVVNFGDCPAEDSETLHNGTARVFSSLIHAMQVAPTVDMPAAHLTASRWILQWLLLVWTVCWAGTSWANVNVAYWVDASAGQSVNDVRDLSPEAFAPIELDHAPPMPRYAVVWLRVQLHNPSAQAQHWVLELRNLRMSRVQVFREGSTQPVQEAGMQLPRSGQPLPHRYYAVPAEVPPFAVTTVYLRLEMASRPDLSLQVWEQGAFQTYQLADHAQQAAYFGLALGLLVFNCLLGLALRDRLYVFYGGFVAGMVGNIAATTGMGSLYVWPQAIWWGTYGNLVSGLVATWFLASFLIRLLNLQEFTPRAARVLQWNQHLQLLGLIALIVLGEPVYLVVLTFPIVSVAVAVVAIGHATYRGAQGACLVLLAFAALIVGTVLNILWAYGLVADSVWSRNGPQIGSTLEMLLLSLSLAERFVRMQKAKLSAEREAHQAQAQALQAQQARVEALQESERMLETRVAQRTQELQSTLAHLKQTQEDLIQAEKLSALGSMVAGVSHELNTPLGVIVTASTALHERASELQQDFESGSLTRSRAGAELTAVVDACSLIHRCADRSAALVQSFKQVAIDQVSERRRQFSLQQVVEENLVALRASQKWDPWPVVNTVGPDIQCDSFPGPLGQVLTNLVMNAVHHGIADLPGGQVVIGARLEGSMVALWVRDNGRGMDARTLARVFEPFFTTRLGKGGSGLGLSVSHRIATTLLQGDLRAESQPGQGSTFTLTLAQHAALVG